MKQEMMGWQWHQLYHTQIICTSLQTDNRDCLQAGCSSWRPINSVKALNAIAEQPSRDCKPQQRSPYYASINNNNFTAAISPQRNYTPQISPVGRHQTMFENNPGLTLLPKSINRFVSQGSVPCQYFTKMHQQFS